MPFCYIKDGMKNVEQKLVAPLSVREFFSKCGEKGGSATSEKKTKAVRKNGCAPCHPGKKRGRPKLKSPQE